MKNQVKKMNNMIILKDLHLLDFENRCKNTYILIEFEECACALDLWYASDDTRYINSDISDDDNTRVL